MPTQNELRTQITNQIVDALTAGGLPPWRQPWLGDRNCGTPTNIVSKKNYSGINPLLLAIANEKHGFKSRWWGTFKQWSEMGAQVKARPNNVPSGKWGTQIVFCRPISKTEKLPDGEVKDKTFFMLRSYTVFNIDQVQGGSLDHLRAGNAPLNNLEFYERHEQADEVVGATFADIRFGGDKACYKPKEDIILMPEREKFISNEAYFETVLHEMTHWTEHETRLNWDRTKQENSYALGELIAELGACYLMSELGIPLSDTWENSASYLQHWIKAMKGDARFIFRATAQASKAADHILSYSRTLAPVEVEA